MTRSIRLGMLTPSSNTVLEPLTFRMIAGLDGVTAHFSRFKVTEIGLSEAALSQFDDTEVLRAAELLAHARVDVINWNGTSAAWKGFDTDERLCRRIEEATGIPACTAVLAFREIFTRKAIRRVGLVTPYLDDVQRKIAANWAREGFDCSAERHLRLSDNYSFSAVEPDTIAGMIRSVAAQGCDAVAVVCTNLRGAALAASLEAELGIPIYDSVSVALWKSLCVAGVAPDRVSGWGSLFRLT
jgi:maleate isomerase